MGRESVSLCCAPVSARLKSGKPAQNPTEVLTYGSDGIILLQQISLTKCDFLVDLETERETEQEPNFVKRTKEWEVIIKKPFLDTERWVTTNS